MSTAFAPTHAPLVQTALDLLIQADAMARDIDAARLTANGPIATIDRRAHPEGLFLFSFARPLKGYERRGFLHRPDLPGGFKRRTHAGAGLTFHTPNPPPHHWVCVDAPSRTTPRDDAGTWLTDAQNLMKKRAAGDTESIAIMADLWGRGLQTTALLLTEHLAAFNQDNEDLAAALTTTARDSRTSLRATFALRLGKLITLRTRAHLRADPSLQNDRARLGQRVRVDLLGGGAMGGSVLKAYVWQIATELRRFHRADPAIERATHTFRTHAQTLAHDIDIPADALLSFLTTTHRTQHRRAPLLHSHNALFGHQNHEDRPRHLRYPHRSPLSHRCRRDAIITALTDPLQDTPKWSYGAIMWRLAMRKERYDPPTTPILKELKALPRFEGQRIRHRDIRQGIKDVLEIAETMAAHLEACRLTLLEDLQIIAR